MASKQQRQSAHNRSQTLGDEETDLVQPVPKFHIEYLKSVSIENQLSLNKIDNSVEKFIFKIFDRNILQECSVKGGYFDQKFISFERPYGSQTKKESILISKYIHSKCLAVKGLYLLLPELDLNLPSDVDDETVDKLFKSIGEIGESKKLQILEIDLKRWKKCTNASLQSVAAGLDELFSKGSYFTRFSLNLDSWRETTDFGVTILSNSLHKLSFNCHNLTHLSLSFEEYTSCTGIAAESIILATISIVKSSHILEYFKLSLWNWTKCENKCCELSGELMKELGKANKLLTNVDFNFFGWTKSTDEGMKYICEGVTKIFQETKRLLTFSLNISSWRGVTEKGVNQISQTFQKCIFTLQPCLVEANVTFAKSDKVMFICNRYLRVRFLARMQFLVFYKKIEWHVNEPTLVSQDLYIDTLKQNRIDSSNENKPIVELKANVKMNAYHEHLQKKFEEKVHSKRLKF